MVVSSHAPSIRNERLRSAIHRSGLTHDQVAERAGVDPKTLERWIAGRIPHPRNRHALAAALGVGAAELWPESEAFDAALGGDLVGLVGAFVTRSQFLSEFPPERLFADATAISISGLSNNLLCQHYADQRLEQLLCLGTTVTCLFLDPAGAGTAAREVEEGYEPGHLANLTRLNVSLLQRLKQRLPAGAQPFLSLAVYDQTIRFNITLVDRGDEKLAVVQPYLPHSRGVDSPTLVVQPTGRPGLYETFCKVWEELNSEARPC